MILRLTTLVAVSLLASCGPDYSPNTYASNAAQQANKVEQGVVVGVRDVAVSASGTVGALAGGAAGGIAGAQAGAGPVSAFSALGGTLVGGLAGTAVEHATGDTRAFEYIVRKPNGDLVSVTQKDSTPLALGQKVLVIAGSQARVVPDYTVNLTPGPNERAAVREPVGETTNQPAEVAPAAASQSASPDAGSSANAAQGRGAECQVRESRRRPGIGRRSGRAGRSAVSGPLPRPLPQGEGRHQLGWPGRTL